jgi:hypothetical protein
MREARDTIANSSDFLFTYFGTKEKDGTNGLVVEKRPGRRKTFGFGEKIECKAIQMKIDIHLSQR